jgi:predicted Zn-ribbon and HTH transcriptional regulator
MSREPLDPDVYVRENREKILAVIKNSDDPYTRACAWTLLDRHTPEKDLEELKDELDALVNRGDPR